MVRFQCDTCGKLRERDETWILGFAADNIGVTSSRREVSISGAWDRSGAVEPLAIHFCSEECRNEYMNRIFGETPATLEGEVTIPTRRVKRVIPGAVVDTVVAEKPGPIIVKKRTALRKKRA